jgi:hypothetical protein
MYTSERAGEGLSVGRTSIGLVMWWVERTPPALHHVAHSLHPHTSGNRQISSEVGCLFQGGCRVVVAHDDEREQGYGNGRVTPDGVMAVAAFAK